MKDTHFDLFAGIEAKAQGIALASEKRKELLGKVRRYVRELALRREDRCASANDISRYLVSLGLNESELGNATGGVFTKSEWNFTGQWVTSIKVASHARVVRVWRLKESTVASS